MVCCKWLQARAAIKTLRRAKINAYRQTLQLPPIQEVSRLKNCCQRFFCCCLNFRVAGTNTTAWEYLRTPGTLPNSICTGLLRFIGGALCVFLLLYILKQKLHAGIPTQGLVWAGVITGLGLTLIPKFRLLVLLLAPQVFAQSVRIILLTNAAYIALHGPGKNFRRNLEALTKGLHQCKEDLKDSLQQVLNLVINPIKGVAEFLVQLEDSIESLLENLRGAITNLQTSMAVVAQIMRQSYQWLRDVTDMCNVNFDTPYNHCKNAFKDAVSSCVDTLGQAMSFMCHVDVLDDVCEITKAYANICFVNNIISDGISRLAGDIQNGLESMYEAWEEFFDVRVGNVTFSPPRSNLNFSKNPKDILKTMKQEILQKLDWFLIWPLPLQDILTITVVAVMVFGALSYQYWYVHSDEHDNKYITRGMIQMDIQRRSLGKNGIFPLNCKESKDYVQACSWKWLKGEKTQFKRQLLMVGLSSIPTLIYVVLDLILYHLLMLFAGESGFRELAELPNKTDGESGDNDPLRKFAEQLKIMVTLNVSQCVSSPQVPNPRQSASIGLLIFFCLVSTIIEPYSYRIRHVICGVYYPSRRTERDRWLYTHILNARGTFFSYARTQVLAKLRGDDKTFHVGVFQRLIHKWPCCGKLFWFWSVSSDQCFLCGGSGKFSGSFQRCPVCKSTYCNTCFHELGKECPVCSTQIQFDTEIDEEIGSAASDEEETEKVRMPKTKIKYKGYQRLNNDLQDGSSNSSSNTADEEESDESSSETQSLRSYTSLVKAQSRKSVGISRKYIN